MWNFQRIICIWICCVSCMFGTTQLSSLVQEVPYEYFDEHEQSFYDLDTEQIQAKYDARLLSQQMLPKEQQHNNLENSKSFTKAEIGKSNADDFSHISPATRQLKTNNAATLGVVPNDDSAGERSEWLDETSTRAAAPTSAITETLDELHLPRAASCFTNGRIFTHGQKVPRRDDCEVCLCMDGEIFCWWEKCDKRPTKTLKPTYNDYSEGPSTTHMQANLKTTFKTTLKPIKKPTAIQSFKYDDDDSAEIRGIEGSFHEQLMDKEHKPDQDKKKTQKQLLQKKMTKQFTNKKLQDKKQTQQANNEHFKQHPRERNRHNNENNNHNYGSSGSSSKILNFPENLPSVLYYDYKTEEHHQHQHQHREQHLKHQRQKQELLLKQHEKELKHQQTEQKLQQHVNHHHEYDDQGFNTYPHGKQMDEVLTSAAGTRVEERVGLSGSRPEENKTKLRAVADNSSEVFKYFNNGNENIYGADLQTDSDILPEPPTKKPTFFTSILDTTTTTQTAANETSQLYRYRPATPTAGTITKSTTTTSTRASANTPSTTSTTLKKQMLSTWNDNEGRRNKINNSSNNDNDSTNSNGKSNNKNESSEETTDTDDEDDAFHRWLTSTEKTNKNNFTLNDAALERDEDEDGIDVVADFSGPRAVNNDYNGEYRNYENVDMETGKRLSAMKLKLKATIRAPTMTVPAIVATNVYDMPLQEGEERAIYYGNVPKSKYKQNLSERNVDSNSNNSATSSGIVMNNDRVDSIGYNNNNISPFTSNIYKADNKNNNTMDGPTTTATTNTDASSSSSSSFTSNEDNGVANIVNIDILLTASSADSQHKQHQPTHMETIKQYRPLLQNDLEHEKQIAKAQPKFMQPPDLISSTNEAVITSPLYLTTNNNSNNSNNSGNSHQNITNMAGRGVNTEKLIEMRTPACTNLSSSKSSNCNSNSKTNINNFSNNRASSHSLASSSSTTDAVNFSRTSALMLQTNASSRTEAAVATTPAPPTISTASNSERQCNVMGTLYKIGDVLPQDTGNCLQCICIDGSTSDDTPRVTCSPHNCPPLVLPDLFDATGY